MSQKLEGLHIEFLKKVTGNKMQRIGDDYWRKVVAESVIQADGKQPLKIYIDKSQATVAEWVALRPIFEV